MQRPALASYLEQGEWLGIEGQVIQIGFSEETAFLIPLIQKRENTALVQSLLPRHFDRAMTVQYLSKTGQSSQKNNDTIVPTRTAPSVSPSSQGGEVDGVEHPLVKEALKVFQGSTIHIQ